MEAVPYHAWDVNALSLGLLTHPDTIQREPELVQDFVAATIEGWNYMIQHPKEAAAIGVQHFPLSDSTLLERGIEATLPLLHTAHSQNKPLGWMAEEDWQQTLELMQNHGCLESPGPLERYFTNQFVNEP